MFEQTKLMFLYCVTPVHMGAGQAMGVIDNPIQRERHTNYPNMAGSGIKGALRHHINGSWEDNLVNRLFGPESSSSYHAGAISFGDGQLLAFPVRSLKQAFVYAVSPTTLARLKRLAELTDMDTGWEMPRVDSDHAVVCNKRVLNGDKLVLEAFDYKASESAELKSVGDWIADNALPQDETHRFFRDKIRADLVLLPDDAMIHFVENATLVEAHVCIDDDTGTAKDGGLFYTENLPPETLLIAPVFTSKERSKNGSLTAADEVMEKVQEAFDGKLVQFGGDATTGRGHIVLHFASKKENGEGQS
ncbi:MAG: type III-B CRISPR module RAMP protein Cmr4 [Gammaproteobacteria bacterium]